MVKIFLRNSRVIATPFNFLSFIQYQDNQVYYEENNFLQQI